MGCGAVDELSTPGSRLRSRFDLRRRAAAARAGAHSPAVVAVARRATSLAPRRDVRRTVLVRDVGRRPGRVLIQPRKQDFSVGVECIGAPTRSADCGAAAVGTDVDGAPVSPGHDGADCADAATLSPDPRRRCAEDGAGHPAPRAAALARPVHRRGWDWHDLCARRLEFLQGSAVLRTVRIECGRDPMPGFTAGATPLLWPADRQAAT